MNSDQSMMTNDRIFSTQVMTDHKADTRCQSIMDQVDVDVVVRSELIQAGANDFVQEDLSLHNV